MKSGHSAHFMRCEVMAVWQ